MVLLSFAVVAPLPHEYRGNGVLPFWGHGQIPLSVLSLHQQVLWIYSVSCAGELPCCFSCVSRAFFCCCFCCCCCLVVSNHRPNLDFSFRKKKKKAFPPPSSLMCSCEPDKTAAAFHSLQTQRKITAALQWCTLTQTQTNSGFLQ